MSPAMVQRQLYRLPAPPLPSRPSVGHGLLTATGRQARTPLTILLGAAYRNLKEDRRENYGLWLGVMQQVQAALLDTFQRHGLHASPVQVQRLLNRVIRMAPADNAESHIRLLSALLTPFDDELAAHIQYRLAYGGNVHFEFSGPTGMGKSSCAIALANWIREIPPAELLKHLSFDLNDLPQKLAGKSPGMTVIQDEFLAMVGDGSRTVQNIITNIEDTLRASQVNLFIVSPEKKEHVTTQAELELILWNPEQQWSLFLVWLDGSPVGVVAIPWMPAALWAVYKPWKADNTARSQAGHFRDHTYIAKAAMRHFADPRFVKYMLKGENKPRKADFEDALEFFSPELTASSQADRLVNFMAKTCYAFDRLETEFEAIFGVEPNDGFRNVARRCLA